MAASIRSINGDKVFMARPHQPNSVLSGMSAPLGAKISGRGHKGR